MRNPDAIIIGGGQAGLAMSRSLTARGVDHIVLERGRIGERWHSERWRSLHLLTTNAMSALPGMPHTEDPNAFMHASAFAAYLASYAHRMAAPVITGVAVTRVEREANGYQVSTTAGRWETRAVVIATGACDTPHRPACAQSVSSSIVQMTPSDYRGPEQLPEGGVLVVGASASGAQLAEEIHASGRPVTLAVGDHLRLPRRYRGRDIYVWMDAIGLLNETALEGGNIEAARRQKGPQLVGRPDNRDLDLGVLSRQGVRLLGRLTAMRGAKATFAGDLAQTTAASHTRMLRVLGRIDESITQCGPAAAPAGPAMRRPFLAGSSDTTLDLKREGIRSVVWATGYVRRYPWLKVPVLDAGGDVVHQGGITAAPGLYILGMTFMRRRRSSFIDGCGLDAEDLAPILKAHVVRAARQVA